MKCIRRLRDQKITRVSNIAAYLVCRAPATHEYCSKEEWKTKVRDYKPPEVSKPEPKVKPKPKSVKEKKRERKNLKRKAAKRDSS